jgi:hypothetical protein
LALSTRLGEIGKMKEARPKDGGPGGIRTHDLWLSAKSSAGFREEIASPLNVMILARLRARAIRDAKSIASGALRSAK